MNAVDGTWTEKAITPLTGNDLERTQADGDYAIYDITDLRRWMVDGTVLSVQAALQHGSASATVLTHKNFFIRQRSERNSGAHNVQWYKDDNELKWHCVSSCGGGRPCELEWVQGLGTTEEKVIPRRVLKKEDIPSTTSSRFNCRSRESNHAKNNRRWTRATKQAVSPPLIVNAAGNDSTYLIFNMSIARIKEILERDANESATFYKSKYFPGQEYSVGKEEMDAMAAKIEANSIRLFFVYFISMIGGLFIIGLIIVCMGFKKEKLLERDDLDWTEATDSLEEVESEIELEKVMAKLCGKEKEQDPRGSDNMGEKQDPRGSDNMGEKS